MGAGETDGVPCKPGDFIISTDGKAWICDPGEVKYVLTPWTKIPKCGLGDILTWNTQLNTFECIAEVQPGAEVWIDGTSTGWNRTLGPKPIDPLWVIFWMAIVFTLGVLGVGLTQWWRNRKATREASTTTLEAFEKLMVPELKPKLNEPYVTVIDPVPDFTKEVKMADTVDKNPNSLQDEIQEIYMQIQLARGEINKIPGFMQVCVNAAMQHLNTARDKMAALGGKVK